MKKYLFLLAWIHGSPSDNDQGVHVSKVRRQADLKTQYLLGNNSILSAEIHADSEEIAAAFGYRLAFFNNYTAEYTFSDTIEIDDSFSHPSRVKVITQGDRGGTHKMSRKKYKRKRFV